MQITNVRKETGYIISDLVDFKRIIRNHYNILYISDNLEDMDLKKHKQQQITQHETDHLNNPISIEEIEFIILKTPKGASLVAQLVKNLLAMQGTWV